MAACAALVLARRRGAARAGHSSTGRCHQRGSHEAAAEDLRAAVVQHIQGVHVQISVRRRGRTAADRLHLGPTLRLRAVRSRPLLFTRVLAVRLGSPTCRGNANDLCLSR